MNFREGDRYGPEKDFPGEGGISLVFVAKYAH